MAGGSFDFEVRPRVLSGYAEVLRGCAAELDVVGAAVTGVTVERRWFGHLPESRFLSDRYQTHRGDVLAEVRELCDWLAEVGRGLGDSAERYSAADRVVADAAEDVGGGGPAGRRGGGRGSETVDDSREGGSDRGAG